MGRITVPHSGELPRVTDVVIVGGGVIGCATAFFASEAGLRTVVLERREGLGTLTTAASQECFRAQFDGPDNIQMMLESIAVFESFAEVVRVPECDISLHQQGYLFLTTEEGRAEAMRQRVLTQHSLGLTDAEYLEGTEVRRRFPFVGPTVLAGTYRAGDGWLSAHELTQGFAKGSSADFCLRTPVTGIQCDGQGVSEVQTSRGAISTRCVVAAAGPYLRQVLSMVGADLPVTLLRRQRIIVAAVPEVPPDAPMTIDEDTGALWRPEVGGAALAWALPEEPGEPLENVPADWTFPATVLDGVSRLVPFWGDVAASLTRDQLFPSAGQYTCTPDHKPLIGPWSAVPGVYVNGAYSGHGVMGSASGARRLVELIVDPMANERNPFSCDRSLDSDLEDDVESLVI